MHTRFEKPPLSTACHAYCRSPAGAINSQHRLLMYVGAAAADESPPYRQLSTPVYSLSTQPAGVDDFHMVVVSAGVCDRAGTDASYHAGRKSQLSCTKISTVMQCRRIRTGHHEHRDVCVTSGAAAAGLCAGAVQRHAVMEQLAGQRPRAPAGRCRWLLRSEHTDLQIVQQLIRSAVHCTSAYLRASVASQMQRGQTYSRLPQCVAAALCLKQ
jgi:hypothetical protein